MPLHPFRHLSGVLAVLLAMSFVVFCLQSIIPADPVRAIAGPTAPAATVEAVREQLGLDRPVIVQYGSFLARLAHGDLGTSFRTRQPIMSDVGRHLPATLER
jgi:peptide/nickel transport system permease protein/dipeptide transport system permease protein